VALQRRFRTKFGKDLGSIKNSIKQWYEKLQRDGCLCIAKRTARPDPSVERVERVREAFQRSPGKSTNRASLELDILQPTVWRILSKRLRVKPYRQQLQQDLTDEDKTRRVQFCTDMLQHLEENGFAQELISVTKLRFTVVRR
jgi:hypothetical protein